MNIWILQDQPGTSLRVKLTGYKKGEIWWWNVDRYIHVNNPYYMQEGDVVLLWQTHFSDMSPAGIYAVGKIINGPARRPNAKSGWQIDILLENILEKPVTKQNIQSKPEPELKKLDVLRMPGGHIVFYVTPSQWDKSQEHFSSLRLKPSEVV